jgi:hypothetical protein
MRIKIINFPSEQQQIHLVQFAPLWHSRDAS